MSIPDFPSPVRTTDTPNRPLPVTTYVWFALLCLGGVLSRVPGLSQPEAAVPSRAADASGVNRNASTAQRADSTSAEDFTRLVQVESATRATLSGKSLASFATGVAREQGRPFGAPKPTRPDDPQRSSNKLTQDAVGQTRAFAQSAKSANFARRVLVLEHATGHPLDIAWLHGTLTSNLRGRGKSASDIAQEQQFWQELYGQSSGWHLSSVQQDQLVQSMELGLVGDKLRADVTRARGQAATADALDKQVAQTATRSYLLTLAVNSLMLLAGLAGLGLIIFLIVIAAQREWKTLKPIPGPKFAPEFGTLIDCFVFYFALLWLARPLLGWFAHTLLPQGAGSNGVGTSLLFSTGGYVLIHGLAAVYASFALRRRGLRLSDIGLHTGQMSTNIGIGILGYCAALPIVAILGLIAKAIFQGNPNVTPNPALPLLASSDGIGQKLLLFLLVAVAAPLFEEFFFRGVLYTGLRSRFGVAASIVISAALFAIGHPLQDWLPIFGLGMALACVRELRQSLVPGMTLHFLQNAGTFLSLSVLFSR